MFFKIADSLFVSGDDRRHIGIGDAIEKLFDLSLDRRALRLQRALGFNLGGEAAAPERLKHRSRSREHVIRWLHAAEDRRELRLDRFAPDCLAVALASALGTEVIRIQRIFTFGPAGGERRTAVAADDGAAQGKIGIEVLAGRRAGVAGDAILNLLERLEADQWLVMAFAE